MYREFYEIRDMYDSCYNGNLSEGAMTDFRNRVAELKFSHSLPNETYSEVNRMQQVLEEKIRRF